MKLKVNIGFAQYVATIEFNPFLGENIEKYIEAFENWYYEEVEVDGGVILKQRSNLPYKYFDTQVIIDWLLEVSPSCNVFLK